MHVMLFMFATALAISLTTEPLAAQTPSNLADPQLDHCLVSVKDEVRLPAQEPGVLIGLDFEEGDQISEGQLLGRIDDSERRMQKQLALIEQSAAKERSENDINVRYSVAAAEVARQEYRQAIEANSQVRGTYPLAEVRRLKLAYRRAALQVEQAEHEQLLSGFEVQTRAAEVQAADDNIARRKLVAPFDGEVVGRFKHVGEWVTPGEAVLRIVRFDTLRVESFLNAADYDPGEVRSQQVTVTVKLARDRMVEMPGRVVYVSSLVEAGGEYLVRAEVENRKENDQWVLRPGLTAAMTIHLTPLAEKEPMPVDEETPAVEPIDEQPVEPQPANEQPVDEPADDTLEESLFD